MKHVLNQVALLKKADAALQVIVFTTLCILCYINVSHLVWYMLTMAALHVVSCISWTLFFNGDTPTFKAGSVIRRLFLIVMAIAVLVTVINFLFGFFAIFMLYFGPLCGLAYFIITLLEINFYSKARKPYYLL